MDHLFGVEVVVVDGHGTVRTVVAPARLLERVVVWAWDERMTEGAFTTLLRNFGVWNEQNSAAGTPEANLYAILQAPHRSAGISA